MSITGKVSEDLAGWITADPAMMGHIGSLYLFASTHKDVSTRLAEAERRNRELTEENARLRETNARIQQALDDVAASQTPRAIISSFGGALVGAGIGAWAAKDYVVGPLLTLAGAVISGTAAVWRVGRKGPAA
jgi:hypothetical protein